MRDKRCATNVLYLPSSPQWLPLVWVALFLKSNVSWRGGVRRVSRCAAIPLQSEVAGYGVEIADISVPDPINRPCGNFAVDRSGINRAVRWQFRITCGAQNGRQLCQSNYEFHYKSLDLGRAQSHRRAASVQLAIKCAKHVEDQPRAGSRRRGGQTQ